MKKAIRKHKYVFIMLCVMFAVAIVFEAIAVLSRPEPETDPYQEVANINQIPVSLGELQIFVDDVRETTASYFMNKHGIDDISGENWTKSIDGEAPVDYAVKLALNELVRYKIVQQLCLEYGIVDDISYESFIEKLNRENTARKERNKGSDAIFGPNEYTKSAYYDYLQDVYEARLMATIEIEYTDDDLLKVYEANRGLFYNFGSVTIQMIVLPQKDFLYTEVKSLTAALIQRCQDLGSIELAAEEAGLLDYLKKKTFVESDFISSSKYQAFEDDLLNLGVGGISDVIKTDNSEWVILYCESRYGNEETPFEECEDKLIEIFREEYCEDMIKHLVGEAEITISDTAKEYLT